MGLKLLHGGFETSFGPSTLGSGAKAHLKSRFCAIFKKGGAMLQFEIDRPHSPCCTPNTCRARGVYLDRAQGILGQYIDPLVFFSSTTENIGGVRRS